MLFWTDEERAVFEYADHTGAKRFADPLAVYRDLLTFTDGQLEAVYRAAYPSANGEELAPQVLVTREQAAVTLAAAAVGTFGLKPFDAATGEGATERMALGLLGRFNQWLGGLKKKATS